MSRSQQSRQHDMFSENWMTGFQRCAAASSAFRKRYGINLDATDPSRKITMREAEGLYDYLLDSGFSVGPSMYVLNMDKMLTLDGLRRVRELLCRWPHPSELALLQSVLLSRLPEQYAAASRALPGKKAGKLFSDAARLLEEQARDRSYYVGRFDVTFFESSPASDVISMVVGKKGCHFARVTHRHRLMYVWTQQIDRAGSRYRIFCYGRNLQHVRNAMEEIQNQVIRVSASLIKNSSARPVVISDQHVQKLFFDSNQQQQRQRGGRTTRKTK